MSAYTKYIISQIQEYYYYVKLRAISKLFIIFF